MEDIEKRNQNTEQFSDNFVVPDLPDIVQSGAECETSETKKDKSGVLRVYKKKSTFKGAKEDDFWYSATRSDGCSINLVFKCPVMTDSKAFEISNVVGTCKKTETVKNATTYINFTYYISSCDFREIVGEELPL